MHILHQPISPTLANALTFSRDIGMFSLSRPISSCTHKTPACARCHQSKLYDLCGHVMVPKDINNEAAWIENDVDNLVSALRRKKADTSRIRLMCRGEAFSTLEDVTRVERLVSALTVNSKRLVWVSTRAWRDKSILKELLRLRREYRGLRILASIDDYSLDSPNDLENLHVWLQAGGGTMYFGDDTRRSFVVAGREYRMFECPKTHKGIKGACMTCRLGCFARNRRGGVEGVHVHLKRH